MSLRTRLILSYALVIGLSLTLAFALLLLVARPLQTRLTTARLSLQSRAAATRLERLVSQGRTVEQLQAQIENLGQRNNLRLLLLNAHFEVLADSAGEWQGQSLQSGQNSADTNVVTTGRFTAPTGGSFLYAAQPVHLGDDSGYVAAVENRPSLLRGLVAELGWGFLLAAGAAMLVSLLLGVLIARSIALPLQNIAAAAAAVAAGEYEHRLDEKGPPEVKRVAASFNVMIERVKSSQQAMRDFVSNVSHELKTPLTSIQGFAQAIMEGATHDEAARRKAAGIIYEEASRMARLVEDLLDLARIDSGQIVMQKTPLDLTQILTAAVKRMLPQATQKQVELVRRWGKLPGVIGDGDRLAQVFTNFLDNAIRHTPPGGQVTLSASVVRNLPRPRRRWSGPGHAGASTALSERVDFVEVVIEDTGPGIPAQELGRIFERFYQVDKSRKRRGVGAGLGLAISKEIIDAHGGYIRAESKEGVGTKFRVLLPVADIEERTVVSTRG